MDTFKGIALMKELKGQFINMVSGEFSVQRIICLIAFVIALIINSRFTHQNS